MTERKNEWQWTERTLLTEERDILTVRRRRDKVLGYHEPELWDWSATTPYTQRAAGGQAPNADDGMERAEAALEHLRALDRIYSAPFNRGTP